MPQGFFSSMPNRVMGTLILVALFMATCAYANLTFKQSYPWYNNPVTINVTGTGEVTMKPDIAQFSFSVRGEGADAATAQTQSANAINAITAYLKEQGIEDKDIKTENYNLTPKYKYVQTPCMYGTVCPPGEQVADGFEVYQMITVKVRKTDTAGELLTHVGSLGATDISGLSFTIDDVEAIKAQARDIAIADAKAKAAKLSKSLGLRIVRIAGFSEDNSAGYYPYAPMMDVAMSGAKAEIAPAPALPSGENKTTVNVTITYEVK